MWPQIPATEFPQSGNARKCGLEKFTDPLIIFFLHSFITESIFFDFNGIDSSIAFAIVF